ncbi:MAG TPA: MarR family transcriptional regulator [Streptosporangiaceae bacterium]
MARESVIVDRWRALAACYNEVACHLDRELHATHGLTMSEFEALDRLIGAECEQRRMQELAVDMYLSQSALSRTVARLEKQGLVERGLCESDRRGVVVQVTAAGFERHAQARATHLAILEEHLAAEPANA